MENNIADNILDKIKDKKPKSKFAFLAKNYAYWFAGIFSIVIGAITVSVMIFIFANHEWALASRSGGILKHLVYVLPYFWLLVFALFVTITYFEIKHIKGGYRVTLPIIIGVYILSTFVLGFGLYKLGAGEEVEDIFVEKAPFYHHFAEPRQRLFQDPEQGLLIGRVLQISGDEMLLLDFDGEEWIIYISQEDLPPHLETEMLLDKMMVIFGESQGDHMFEAEGIRPHVLPGMGPQMKMQIKGMKEINMPMRSIR